MRECMPLFDEVYVFDNSALRAREVARRVAHQVTILDRETCLRIEGKD